jgi:hypothetical protein
MWQPPIPHEADMRRTLYRRLDRHRRLPATAVQPVVAACPRLDLFDSPRHLRRRVPGGQCLPRGSRAQTATAADGPRHNGVLPLPEARELASQRQDVGAALQVHLPAAEWSLAMRCTAERLNAGEAPRVTPPFERAQRRAHHVPLTRRHRLDLPVAASAHQKITTVPPARRPSPLTRAGATEACGEPHREAVRQAQGAAGLQPAHGRRPPTWAPYSRSPCLSWRSLSLCSRSSACPANS